MSHKKQHYVPKAYLKPWISEVINRKNDKFHGVYVIDKYEYSGEGFNIDNIMYKPHLYTINFGKFLLLESCPKIRQVFIEEIYKLMNDNLPSPVYGKYKDCLIKEKEDIDHYLNHINEWDFFYYNEDKARNKSILNRINDLNCYDLEISFDNHFEKKWESYYREFILGVKNNEQNNSDLIHRMVESLFIMLFRNLHYDALGYDSKIKNNILLPNSNDERGIENLMKNFQYSDLYNIFYDKSKGIYNNIVTLVQQHCRIILFEATNDAGSFLTSDNPSFLHKSLPDEKYNMSGFVFPITPSFLLLVTPSKSQSINEVNYVTANKEIVIQFNRIIKNHCIKTLISNRRKIYNLLEF